MSRRTSITQHEDMGLEMTTFNQPQITRSRSGSFTGSLDYVKDARPAGNVSFRFSQRSGVFDVTHIVSHAPGVGREMMGRVEDIARQSQARSMETATSRPGFFKRMGFDYTDGQKEINRHRYSADELVREEQNRGAAGGGFVMHKPLV